MFHDFLVLCLKKIIHFMELRRLLERLLVVSYVVEMKVQKWKPCENS